MVDFSLVLLSDVHLSRSHPYFYHNWRVACEASNALEPDVVVVSGDLSFNGPDVPDDLTFAADELRRLSAGQTWLLPGNHDVGYGVGIGAEQEITPERRAAYVARVGADFWHFDHGGWRFLGLNPFLLESGLPAEQEQLAMIDAALSGHTGPVGVFTHVPFFGHDPDETGLDPSATLLPGPRKMLLERFAKAGTVRFIGSGHLHRHKRMSFAGIDHVWAPGTAFMSSAPKAGARGGDPWVGFLHFRFSGETYSIDVIEPDDMINMDLRNWMRGPKHGYYKIAAQPFRQPDTP